MGCGGSKIHQNITNRWKPKTRTFIEIRWRVANSKHNDVIGISKHVFFFSMKFFIFYNSCTPIFFHLFSFDKKNILNFHCLLEFTGKKKILHSFSFKFHFVSEQTIICIGVALPTIMQHIVVLIWLKPLIFGLESSFWFWKHSLSRQKTLDSQVGKNS